MELTTAKFLIAFSSFVISLASSVAPLKVIKVDALYFSIGNLLASGILLAAGLVHQLPDSIESLEGATTADFPWATFIAGLTFCAFMVFEEYLHTEFEENPFESDDHEHIKSTQQQSDDIDGSSRRRAGGHHHDHHHLHQHNNNSDECTPLKGKENGIATHRRESFLLVSSNRSLHTHVIESSMVTAASIMERADSGESNGNRHSVMKPNKASGIMDFMRQDSFEDEHPIHVHEEHLAEHMHGSLISSVLLLLALSVHSFLEGFAIGVATSKKDVVSTATAVLAHKAFAGYALGSSMVASHMKASHILILCLIFSSCGPIGLLGGMVFHELIDTENDTISMGVIQAVVAGTFLYVSIVEIGMKELMMHRESPETCQSQMSPTRIMCRKLSAFLVGYLLMSVLALWV